MADPILIPKGVVVEPLELVIETLPEFERVPVTLAEELIPKLLAPVPALITVPSLFKLLVLALINNGPSQVEATAVEVLGVQLAAFVFCTYVFKLSPTKNRVM